MSHQNARQQQDQNTGKLVMHTFYKMARKDGVTATEIAKYLQENYGDVWRVSSLIGRADDTLKRSANLGFLDRRGDRYVVNLARELRCGKRRRRLRSSRRKRRRKGSCRQRLRRLSTRSPGCKLE